MRSISHRDYVYTPWTAERRKRASLAAAERLRLRHEKGDEDDCLRVAMRELAYIAAQQPLPTGSMGDAEARDHWFSAFRKCREAAELALAHVERMKAAREPLRPVGECLECGRQFLTIGAKSGLVDNYHVKDKNGGWRVCGGKIGLYRPMTGIQLSSEQREKLRAYTGPIESGGGSLP